MSVSFAILGPAAAALAAVLVWAAPMEARAGLDPLASIEGPAVELAARPAGDVPDPGWALPSESSDLVRRVQEALGELGLYQGPRDGVMTPATEKAVRAYQSSTGITVDGRVTRQLVEGLENSIQVRILLHRLDKIKIENMSAARQALLSHPATRDLVTGARDEVADPTRDSSACLETVTVRCLLSEALESAKAVFKHELRDWALGEILVAEARAGLGEAAMETASRIRDPRLIIVALRDIAEAQAAAGRSAQAITAADIIPDPVKKAEALAAIAGIQVRRGDSGDARATAERLLESVDAIGDALARVDFQTRVAVILARSGDAPQAADILATAEAFARTRIEGAARGIALRHVANALAETKQLAQAFNILNDVTDDSNRTPVLITAATQQARAGDAAAALATADTIEAVRFRAVVLGQIALAQAEAGEMRAAEVTLAMARAAIEKIKLPYARSYALSRVSLSMAGIGKIADTAGGAPGLFERAVGAAQEIDDNRLRAHTLWTIAAEQIRAGDDAGAQQTKALADVATQQMKSTLSRVWMFSEIATGHAAEGEGDAAWAAFDRGLQVARSIDNAWGRARAFGKLAATLITLVTPGKGLAPGTW
ncbi:MAG: peptidoglycan-binding protein [Rhodospirillales bacterium]